LRPIEKVVFQKITGKAGGKQLAEKSELKDLMELCPFIFHFPQITPPENSSTSLSPAAALSERY
jgi:hypothetical protein